MKLRRLPFIIVGLALVIWGCVGNPPQKSIFRYPLQTEASPQLLKLIQEVGTSADHPNANAIYIADEDSTIFQRSGLYEAHIHLLVKVLNERGKKDFGVVRLKYDRLYDSLVVTQARVIAPDGSITNVPDFTIKEITQSEDAEISIYWSGSREKVITFPNLTVGSVVEYRACYLAKQPFIEGVFDWGNWFQGEEPKLLVRETLIGPKEVKIYWFCTKNEDGKIRFSQREKGEQIIYRWVAEDLSQIVEEPGMPPMGEVARRILVTTNTWKKTSRDSYELSEPMLKTDRAIKKKVAELTKGLETDEEKIKIIYYWVAQQIRYVGLSFGKKEGQQPHPVVMTFKNGQGVCKDKSALLVAMLREAGLDAYYVLTNPGTRVVSQVATDQFNHAIAAVRRGDGTYSYLDPTDDLCRDFLPAYEGDKGVLVSTKEGAEIDFTPILPPQRNMGNIVARSEVNEEGDLKSRVTITGNGFYDEVLRSNMRRKSPQERRIYWQEKLQGIFPGAVLLKFSVSPQPVTDLYRPIKIVLEYEAPGYGYHAGDFFVFSSPLSSGKLAILSHYFFRNAKLPQRRYPLDLWTTFGSAEEETLFFPTSYRVRALPDSVKVDHPKLSYGMSFIEGEDRVIYRKELLIGEPQVPPQDYPVLRDILKASSRSAQGSVVLERTPKM